MTSIFLAITTLLFKFHDLVFYLSPLPLNKQLPAQLLFWYSPNKYPTRWLSSPKEHSQATSTALSSCWWAFTSSGNINVVSYNSAKDNSRNFLRASKTYWASFAIACFCLSVEAEFENIMSIFFYKIIVAILINTL